MLTHLAKAKLACMYKGKKIHINKQASLGLPGTTKQNKFILLRGVDPFSKVR